MEQLPGRHGCTQRSLGLRLPRLDELAPVQGCQRGCVPSPAERGAPSGSQGDRAGCQPRGPEGICQGAGLTGPSAAFTALWLYGMWCSGFAAAYQVLLRYVRHASHFPWPRSATKFARGAACRLPTCELCLALVDRRLHCCGGCDTPILLPLEASPLKRQGG